ncbi:MAG: formate-dependent phosphoribosylglycinamide formyltransferase [Gordonia sp. (in: high G+C Gram-positive bacteria)]|uniref:formate-dependent phosphoribosylglycinamide formyltransferase n=1 Tax=Gordonia sp. (in: high G+C Gram-positive bacteria) TaxID=84139 RepID=UPI0039E4ECAE
MTSSQNSDAPSPAAADSAPEQDAGDARPVADPAEQAPAEREPEPATEPLGTGSEDASSESSDREHPAGPVTVLGTPQSPTATRVMLLGSGELGKEVTIALQRLGVEVVAVDRYAGAPAHQVAHAAEVIDMMDPAAVRAVIEKHRPRYVLPEIEAIATDALVEVEREGIAEVIPSAKGVSATLNREGIRRLADEELGLPTSSYLFADSEEELRVAAYRVGYPCVVKPVMSSSGKGQTVMHSDADVASSWEAAKTGGRVDSGRVIVERFIDFDYEVTLLTVRAVDPETGELATYFCEPIGHRQSGGDYVESWQPQPMNRIAYGTARSIAARIVTAMGDAETTGSSFSGRGVFGVELFVKGDEVFFSEVSPRPHDTGLVTLATQRLSEFELHARAVLGLPVNVETVSPGASAVIYGRHDEEAIRFAGVAEALADPQVDLRLFGKPESFAKRRMGVVVARGADTDEARRRAARAAETVIPLAAGDPIPGGRPEASADAAPASAEKAAPETDDSEAATEVVSTGADERTEFIVDKATLEARADPVTERHATMPSAARPVGPVPPGRAPVGATPPGPAQRGAARPGPAPAGPGQPGFGPGGRPGGAPHGAHPGQPGAVRPPMPPGAGAPPMPPGGKIPPGEQPPQGAPRPPQGPGPAGPSHGPNGPAGPGGPRPSAPPPPR